MSPESFTGLSDVEAAVRLRCDGENYLQARGRSNLLRICIQILIEPMFVLLLMAVAIYWVMGDTGDALVLLGFVTIIMSTTVLQQRRTDRLIDKLKELLVPTVMVMRQGRVLRINSKHLVCGDITLIGEGQRIPADGVVVSTPGLRVDESLLTGESFPVERAVSQPLLAGTVVSNGSGLFEVTATGAKTKLGQIGLTVKEIVPPQSPLRRNMARLTQQVLVFAAAASLGLGIALFILWDDWARAALAGLTLAMGILPQEFPTVLILFLALAARRLARHQLLIRRLDSIEAIGKITALCLDKTGTLTKNMMSLTQMQLPSGESHQFLNGDQVRHSTGPPGGMADLLVAACLACDPRSSDPMETELLGIKAPKSFDRSEPAKELVLVHQYPFRSSRLSVTQLWRAKQESHLQVASKGAPEAILNLCRINGPQRDAALGMAEAMARLGLRVLAVAKGSHDGSKPYPDEPSEFVQTWLGLLGFEDPLKPDARESVEACKKAGVRVLMITGDHAATALAIAKQAGIIDGGVVSGLEFERANSTRRGEIVQENVVFARVSPLQKLQIVESLQSCGEVVAMTGDGVNDAPALRAADVGIAMGRRGTDAAREAASIILLDDNFSSVVEAIRSGRATFENLQKAMVYTLGVHIPIVMLAFLPVVFGTPLLLTPVHIAFLELAINPTTSLVFEAEQPEDGVMRRHPFKGQMFSRQMMQQSLVQGVFVGVLLVAAYLVLLGQEASAELAGATVFAMLVSAGVGLVLSGRRPASRWYECLKDPPIITLVVLGAMLTGVFIAVTLPAVSAAFRFQSLPPFMALVAMGIGLLTFIPLHTLRKKLSSGRT